MLTVKNHMMCSCWKNLDVLWSIVVFDSVDVVYGLLGHQASIELGFCNQTVLVGVSSTVGKMVINTNSDQDVAVAGHRSPTFPERIAFAFVSRHAPSVIAG